MPNIQPIKAIYYPHVEFKSAAWVKSLLLYWEGVYRPLPRGVEPQDEPEIRHLFEAGLLEDLPLEPFAVRSLDLLGQWLEELLRERNGRLPASMPEIPSLRGIDPALIDGKREEAAQLFKSRGWKGAAKVVSTMRGQTIALYATALNCVIAQERNLAPVTDDPVFDAMSTWIDVGSVTDRRAKVLPVDGLAAAQVFVPALSVEAADELSVERLVEIRRKLAAQRRSFREKVQTRANAIAALPNVEAVNEHLEALAADVREELEAAREAMKEAKIQSRWTLLGVSAPASLAVGLALAGQAISVAGPPGLAGSVAFGVTEWVFEHRREQRESKGHYLLSVQNAVESPERRGLAGTLRGLVSG